MFNELRSVCNSPDTVFRGLVMLLCCYDNFFFVSNLQTFYSMIVHKERMFGVGILTPNIHGVYRPTVLSGLGSR